MPSAATTIASQPAVVGSRSTAAVAYRADIGLDAVKGLQARLVRLAEPTLKRSP